MRISWDKRMRGSWAGKMKRSWAGLMNRSEAGAVKDPDRKTQKRKSISAKKTERKKRNKGKNLFVEIFKNGKNFTWEK